MIRYTVPAVADDSNDAWACGGSCIYRWPAPTNSASRGRLSTRYPRSSCPPPSPSWFSSSRPPFFPACPLESSRRRSSERKRNHRCTDLSLRHRPLRLCLQWIFQFFKWPFLKSFFFFINIKRSVGQSRSFVTFLLYLFWERLSTAVD